MKNMWYEENPLSLVVCSDGTAKKILAPFKPYCFVEETKKELLKQYLTKLKVKGQIEETNFKTLEEEKVCKVIVETPKQIKFLRERVPVRLFEADIPYVRRVMLDMNWQIDENYKIGFWDIEVNEKTGKIVALSLVGLKREECFVDGEEKELICNFLREAKKYDMLVGYNSDLYDYPKLLNAVKKLGVNNNLKYWRFLDLLQLLKSRQQRMLQSWSLQYVAETFVGESRVHTDKKIFELTQKEIEERCLKDAVLLKMLNEKLGLIEVAIAMAKISYVFPDEVYFVSRCVDSLMLKEARKLNYVLPSKPSKPKKEASYRGAMVLHPPEPFKVYENVAVFDFASLYPNVIINYKISPDKEKKLYPQMLSNLLEMRLKLKEEWKKTKDVKKGILQQAYKQILNASYGVLASAQSRIQRADLSAEVAKKGRELLEKVITLLKEKGYNVIYGDTDSIFVQTDNPEQVKKEIASLGFKVDVDKVFKRLYFPKRAGDNRASKKKYAGLTVEGNIITVGMETVRSDYPEAARSLQRLLIQMHLNGSSEEEKRQLIKDFKTVLFNGLLDINSLAIYKTYTREKYKVKTPHSVVVSILKEKGVEVLVGDKIGFVYTVNGVKPLEVGVVPDYKYYWKHVFSPMIERTVGLKLKEDESLEKFM